MSPAIVKETASVKSKYYNYSTEKIYPSILL